MASLLPTVILDKSLSCCAEQQAEFLLVPVLASTASFDRAKFFAFPDEEAVAAAAFVALDPDAAAVEADADSAVTAGVDVFFVKKENKFFCLVVVDMPTVDLLDNEGLLYE